ncbi:MAG: hypothetical protein U0414_36750 [Polyangiaceae bacterium]
MERFFARGVATGTALVLSSCAYDLTPYQVAPEEGTGAGSTHAVSSAAAGGAPGQSSSSTSSGDGGGGGGAGSSSSGVQSPYDFCNEYDSLEDSGNWNEGNKVAFNAGHADLGPDNNLSYVAWHDDLHITPPCVFTTRLIANTGTASFGLRKNGNNQVYILITDAEIHGLDPNAIPLQGALPMTLAIVVTATDLVTGFKDADGWHRVDSIPRPDWISSGIRSVMAKAGDDLSASFDEYNADPVRPADVGEPPLGP